MRTSLNVGVFQQGSSVDRMIAETARAGFDAIELTITTHGPLTFEASERACIHISKQAFCIFGIKVLYMRLDFNF